MSDDPRQQALRREYMGRINRVLDHIEAHLAEELTLPALAKVACFSPYHFHRLFRAFLGEPLGHFIGRLRAERAARQLVLHPTRSITEIALECGYSSSATFARAFRDAFGTTPTEWREAGYRKMGKAEGNERTPFGKPGDDGWVVVCEVDPTSIQLTWRVTMSKTKLVANVTVRELPETQIAYLRHIGPYAGDAALFERLFTRLMTWAGPRGLLGPDAQCLAIYYDDPSVTDQSKLRLDCCLVVPAGTAVDGEIGQGTIPAGKYAAARFELAPSEYGDAWDAVMAGWLPESGYQPADGPCFERYLNDPKQHPEGKHVVEICLPVKPL